MESIDWVGWNHHLDEIVRKERLDEINHAVIRTHLQQEEDVERGMDRLDESDRRNHSNGLIDGIVCTG